MKKTIFSNEVIQFISLFILSALVIYFTPSVVQTGYFLLLLLFFWRSEKDYFWLALIYVIGKDAGGIFNHLTEEVLKVGPINLSLIFLFSIVAFVKVYRKHKKVNFLFKKPFKLYLFYLFFLIYLGLLIYGNEGGGKSGFRYYFQIFIFLIYLLNFYSIPRILNSLTKIEGFIKLIFITLFLNLLGQIYHILKGIPLFIKYGSPDKEFYLRDFAEILVRPVWGHVFILIGAISAMLFYLTKNERFKESYLLVIISLCMVSVFIGATRGWIIALSFMLIGFLLINNKFKSFKFLFIGLSFIGILFISSFVVRNQISKVYDRLTTLEDLAKGDLSAGGTNSRLSTRHDKVMEVFYKYPIFGGGFSTEVMDKTDQHVGNQNILMAGGIIGYLIVLYFWIYYINKVLKIRNKLSLNNKYRNGLSFMIVIFFSTILIHSSSTSLYGYIAFLKGGSKIIQITIIYVILNQFLLSAIEFEKNIRQKKLYYG